MDPIEWDASLSVGVAEIDEQHRRFIETFNNLERALTTEGIGAVLAGCAEAFVGLGAYVSEHFAAEEAYMQRLGYPGLEAHRQLHGEFTEIVQRLQDAVGKDDFSRSSEILGLMTRWLRDHLISEDQKYAEFGGCGAGRAVGTAAPLADKAPSQPLVPAVALWEDSVAAIFVVDSGTHTIVDVNQRAAELFGKPRGELLGRRCHNFICPSEEGACPITDRGLSVDRSERILLTASGKRVPILKSVRRVNSDGRELLLESFVDITQQMVTQRSLERSQSFVRSIIDGIGDPVVVIDPADRRIVLANRAAIEQGGGREPSTGSVRCYELSHGLDTPCGAAHGPCPLEKVLATAKPYRVSHEHLEVSGAKAYVDVHATPVLDERGAVALVVEITHDLTERRRAEEERERLIGELQRAITEIKTLHGILPICSSCKKIRDDSGAWHQLEAYIRDHTTAEFTHGLCADCAEKLYPGFMRRQS